MTGEVVAVVLLFLKVYLSEAESVIIGSTKQLLCPDRSGDGWDKLSDVSNAWKTITDGGRYSGSSSSILTIVNFQIEDSGSFRCRIYGTVIEDSIELKPEVRASIGESVTLTCTVSGTTLYWYRIGNNGLRTLTDNDEYEGTKTKYLKINSLTANTAGIYCCQPLKANKGPDITVSISSAGWSYWNAWSACNVPCGNGQRQRSRACSGGNCLGSADENEDCTVDYGVDGSWSAWFISGTCTVSCGIGARPRGRLCNNPTPANCGLYCNGNDNGYIVCSTSACPVNGGWSSWTSGACNATSCDTGQKSRSRYCNNPLKANGGADCQGEKDELIACVRSECAEQQSGNTPLVVGTVIGILVIVILILILVIYAKRRWYKSKKEPDYDITDMTKVKSHVYGKIHVNHAYQNEQQSAEVEVSNTENQYINEAHVVERYDISELNKRCQHKEYFLQSLKAEFKLLNDSTDDPKPFNSQYEIVNTGLRPDVNQLHVDSSTLEVLYTNNVSILLEPPQKYLVEQFWTIVDNQCVKNIILLATGNENISEFYPMLDDILRINNFEIYLDSAERMNKHIMLLTFNLQNKTTQSIRQIKMFKTNISEYPTVQTLCFVVDKASEISGAAVLIINSKMADLSVCGVLTVCSNVIYAIKNGSLFSVLENALMAKKNNSSFIKKINDYALCYKVLEHYLEAVHTYDFIE